MFLNLEKIIPSAHDLLELKRGFSRIVETFVGEQR